MNPNPQTRSALAGLTRTTFARPPLSLYVPQVAPDMEMFETEALIYVNIPSYCDGVTGQPDCICRRGLIFSPNPLKISILRRVRTSPGLSPTATSKTTTKSANTSGFPSLILVRIRIRLHHVSTTRQEESHLQFSIGGVCRCECLAFHHFFVAFRVAGQG